MSRRYEVRQTLTLVRSVYLRAEDDNDAREKARKVAVGAQPRNKYGVLLENVLLDDAPIGTHPRQIVHDGHA